MYVFIERDVLVLLCLVPQALNGRWFGGQRLVAELYDGFSNFAKSHESHEDQMARLRKFGEALEES